MKVRGRQLWPTETANFSNARCPPSGRLCGSCNRVAGVDIQTPSLYLLKSPGKTTNMSSSDRFPLKLTGENTTKCS